MKAGLALFTRSTPSLLLGSPPVLALNPSLEVSQYGHTAWTTQEGFSLGNISIARAYYQTIWFRALFCELIPGAAVGWLPTVPTGLCAPLQSLRKPILGNDAGKAVHAFIIAASTKRSTEILADAVRLRRWKNGS